MFFSLMTQIGNSNNQASVQSFALEGEASGVYDDATFTYSSSIDSITNLWAGYYYDTGYSNLPICILIHGWSQTGSTYYIEAAQRIASYGYFAVSVGMRGRDGATGSRDGSGRELHDIYDAIQYIKANFSNVNGESIVIAGWSGGGGNVLGFAAKFPDLCQVAVDNFGMSDYGYDENDGWYYTNGSFSASIVDSIGAITDKTLYRSRYSVEQITNYLGYLYIFHDDADSSVSVVNSRNIDAVKTNNYEYRESSSTDADRWTHATPIDTSDIVKAEPFWNGRIFNSNPINISNTGTIKVNGYVKTKEFEIWLGDGVDASQNGMNRTASVVYDIVNKTYTVTPIFETGITDCNVLIIDKNNNQIESLITGETTFNL